jgi:hypothetical protein
MTPAGSENSSHGSRVASVTSAIWKGSRVSAEASVSSGRNAWAATPANSAFASAVRNRRAAEAGTVDRQSLPEQAEQPRRNRSGAFVNNNIDQLQDRMPRRLHIGPQHISGIASGNEDIGADDLCRVTGRDPDHRRRREIEPRRKPDQRDNSQSRQPFRDFQRNSHPASTWPPSFRRNSSRKFRGLSSGDQPIVNHDRARLE